jgi:predicted transcriptional regulator
VSLVSAQNISRLELYIEILSSIDELEASSLLGIQEKTNIEEAFLKHAISFLEKQGLIKKEYVGKDVVYSTTIRGERVARYFSVHNQEVPQEEVDFT